MTAMIRHSLQDISAMRSRYRAQLINAMSGIKGVHLVGSRSAAGTENLAVFNSVMHVGADPAAMAVLFRPLTVQRDTYDNIKETGSFTLNLFTVDMVDAAHQTSAKYPSETSEFAATGLTPEYSDLCIAPYVKESPIRIGLSFAEEHTLDINGTVLVVGRVDELWLPEHAMQEDGWIALDDYGIVSVAGLDTYYQGKMLARKPYAQP
ncbi:flavin reductase family protein [Salinispirillum marinum]|uniref:Flavin reductase family protein n=2 Tax=Saccharospirillaceae TaxID=255527 RepID=A0ABV8BGC3_9GAMM